MSKKFISTNAALGWLESLTKEHSDHIYNLGSKDKMEKLAGLGIAPTYFIKKMSESELRVLLAMTCLAYSKGFADSRKIRKDLKKSKE